MDEFILRAGPKVSNKKNSVFKSHKDDNITWSEVKMKRENDNQPWQIKLGPTKNGRRFKAIKEGGVNENASYFVFYKTNDNTYEVCPIDDWYSVSATQRYKTLTAEEAEQKFEQRHKTLNYFSVMHLKKNGDEMGPGSSNDKKSFKVSELDEWDNSGDDEESDNDEAQDDSKKKAKSRKKKANDDPEDAPEEGREDSDEGDFEHREVDYMSDSSSDSSEEEVEKDTNDVKGIAEEEALRNLLSTDDEEDPDNPQQKTKDTKATVRNVDLKQDSDGNSSDSSDSDDYDVDEEKMDSLFVKKNIPKIVDEPDSPPVSTTSKRKAPPETSAPAPPPRKPRTVEQQTTTSQTNEERIVEDLIKKYLSRKPMTARDLLVSIRSKFKKMSGVTQEMNDNLVEIAAKVITRLKLDHQKINDLTYLSLKM